MLAQLKCLQIACQNLNIPAESLDKNGNFLVICPHKNTELISQIPKIFPKFYFVNSQTPFNSQDSVAICKDKFFCYKTLQNIIKQPKTLSFLDPFCANNYKEYLECEDFEEIADFIQKELNFPLIIKPNSGSLGINVQKVENQKQLVKAIEKIFDTKSRDYDYVMIAQEYIQIKEEFRVITVDGIVELIYQKDISSAEFVGNLSPLHWQGFKTKIIENLEFKSKIQEFAKPIFANLPRLFWVGIDLAIDKNGEIFLIEINTNPGFGLFLQTQEEFYIVNLYQKALTKFLDL
jgi:glutathione synthase/RimK-type ligase-like ATP-grasp enzyme